MGKRNKEPQVGRRRPMIQLGGSSQKSGIGVVSRNAIKEEEKDKDKGLPDEIEDQLAGFLAEINSLDDGSGSSASEPATVGKTLPKETDLIVQKPLYDVETFDPVTQSHLLPENWTAIYDDATCYYYYWNTVTNEVQWYPPAPPAVDAPPPPPPPIEVSEEGPKSVTGNSETNGFHSNNESNGNKSEIVEEATLENIVSEINSSEVAFVNHTSPEPSEMCIKDDDVVLSYSFNSEDNDKAPNTTEQNDSVKPELLDGKKEEKKSSIVCDGYADMESSPQGSSYHDVKVDENVIDPYSITEPIKEKPLDVGPEEKQVDVVVADKTIPLDISKIKEKIQRKKEEKLRKEKEESASKNKNEDSVPIQKSKEEMLREKLIKKKYEREKALTAQEEKVAEESNAGAITNASSKIDDSFSVDMFASEDSYEKVIPPISTTSTIVKNDMILEKNSLKIEEKKKIEKKDNPPPKDVVDENSTKEKGGWRIIDAVYDEDDDEEEEDESDNNNEPEEHHSSEVVEKGKGEMDDYAEMLLEESIVEKEKSKDRHKSKKKKTKRHFIPALPLEAPPPPPPEPENPPLPPEDEPAPQPPPQLPKEEDGNLEEEIKLSSSMLLEKLNVLGISRGEIGKLQQCLIELETRMQDWMAGVLESKYFLARLKEVDVEVLKHETAPAGWISHWSSNFKMYYYYNAATGTSQWDYPTIIQPLPTQPLQSAFPDYQFQPPQMALPTSELHVVGAEGEPSEMEVPASVFSAPPPPPPPPETTMQVSLPASAASLVSPAHGFSREPLPEKNTKNRKRTVAQDSEKSCDPYRDPYRSSKKKKETQVSSDPVSDDGLFGSGSESGTASPLPASVIASGPVMRDAVPEPSQELSLQYASMTPPPPPPPPSGETIEFAAASPRQDNSAQPVLKTKVKKKKKVEGLAPLKKLKHVSSLVQKWQTVKQRVEEEENVEEESDDDYEVASEKRINEWKREMENSEEKNYNPNFTEIKGDWRERLKRKSAT